MGIVLQFQGGVGGQKMLKPTLKDVLLVENLNVRKIRKNEAIDFKSNIKTNNLLIKVVTIPKRNIFFSVLIKQIREKPKNQKQSNCNRNACRSYQKLL